MNTLVRISTVGLFLLHAHLSLAQTRYRITDLGTLGGNVSDASAVSQSGLITGYASDIDGEYYAFIYDEESGMQYLGSLGGSSANDVGYGINDAGQVVGRAEMGFYGVPFIYSPGVGMEMLPSLPNVFTGEALGINELGHSAGYGILEDDTIVPMYWSEGEVEELPLLPEEGLPFGYAVGINASDVVVGSMVNLDFAVQARRAAIWQKDAEGQWQVSIIEPIAGTVHTQAYDLNDRGEVACEYEVYNEFPIPVVWKNGISRQLEAPTDLGFCKLERINNSGEVVGYVASSRFLQEVHAALWETDGSVVVLNDVIDPDLGWDLEFAYDINDAGQIVGRGINGDGDIRGYLLTLLPVCNDADVNADGIVDRSDSDVVRHPLNWGRAVKHADNPRADVNGDKRINGLDIARIRSSAHWGSETGECRLRSDTEESDDFITPDRPRRK